MWSLRAWAAGGSFASCRARCRQGLEVQPTVCFCCSLLGPRVRPSHSLFSYSVSSGYSVLPLFLKYFSKVSVLVSAFVCRRGARYCCPGCIPTQKSALGSVFFYSYLRDENLSHVELSVLNNLWLENGNTFTAQHEARWVGCVPHRPGKRAIYTPPPPPAQDMLFLRVIICTSQILLLLDTM